MTTKKLSVLAMCVCAGGVNGFAFGEESPTALVAQNAQVRNVAHIYFNLATGERVISLVGDGQTAPANSGAGSVPFWSTSSTGASCPGGGGFTTSSFFVVDDNSGTSSLATAATVLSWGDVPMDSVVDCVSINWITDHQDVDADSDGIGDGVAGLGGRWTWWDADNGRISNVSTRMPLISITFMDLPGDTSPPGDSTVAGYTADVDLTGGFSSAMSFEIGDSDSDSQGAAFHNAGISNLDRDLDGLPDSDLDGDGLFDWSWGVRFFQPGTADLDGDGVIDGDIADSMKPIGIYKGFAPGSVVDHGDGTFGWEPDFSAPAFPNGADGSYLIYSVLDDFLPAGGGNLGVFTCQPNGPSIPYAGLAHTLFGPSNPIGCAGDLNGDGDINFFDVALFLEWFGDPERCDYNDDGACNFFDIAAFLEDVSEGCN
ncbi:MAG: hypothetical protein JKX70_11395 [Phycisphaerales bacterium]|nr:hypothetical protein [Phycisphaerales bacterium]